MKKIVLLLTFLFITVVQAETITVTYDSCIDGDTAHFKYGDKDLKVRFIAVNAPEIDHKDIKGEFQGKEAKEYVCNLLSNAKKIQLEYDNNSSKEDKYGRTLAWIWVDDNLLQELLVKNGFAKIDYVYDEYLYIPYLCQVEKKAQKSSIGIWEKEEKLGYCSKVEDTNITLEELRDNKIEDIDIDMGDMIIFGIIISFILFITLISLFIIKRS